MSASLDATLWQDGITKEVNISSAGFLVYYTEPYEAEVSVSGNGDLTYGQAESLTAEVTGNSDTAPTGSVHFDVIVSIGDETIASEDKELSLGVATWDMSQLPAILFDPASFEVMAKYGGDDVYPEATAPSPFGFTVKHAPSEASIKNCPNSTIVAGSIQTLTVVVTPADPSKQLPFAKGPGGTVKLYDDFGEMMPQAELTGSAGTTSQTTLSFTLRNVGNHLVKAGYEGDVRYEDTDPKAATCSITVVSPIALIKSVDAPLAATPTSILTALAGDKSQQLINDRAVREDRSMWNVDQRDLTRYLAGAATEPNGQKALAFTARDVVGDAPISRIIDVPTEQEEELGVW
jgi:hypothetical protein